MISLQGGLRLFEVNSRNERAVADIFDTNRPTDVNSGSWVTVDLVIPRPHGTGANTLSEPLSTFINSCLFFCALEIELAASIKYKEVTEGVEMGQYKTAGIAGLFRPVQEQEQNRNIVPFIYLQQDEWNKGYVTQISSFLTYHAFSVLGAHRVSIGIVDDNKPVCEMLQIQGYVEEGKRRKAHWRDGSWHDVHDFGIIEEDWQILMKKMTT